MSIENGKVSISIITDRRKGSRRGWRGGSRGMLCDIKATGENMFILKKTVQVSSEKVFEKITCCGSKIIVQVALSACGSFFSLKLPV